MPISVTDFKKNRHAFEPVIINGKELSVFNSEAINKVNKRLHFLVLLERAGVNPCNIVNFDRIVVGPVLEYCSPIFHHEIPKKPKQRY